ncbi:uncharacterized protein MONOS_6056 [Monocercomonoides exilis]|uniref:uncharacterized protein n=1 Tax=Monocercomonoides exilis TaxID=2049356 RepID=UPI00355A6BD7|nr:hypothetical protein MONOS_6056 [Monocercomonoides exilis]|eukprot:MONOS_6056.1-p1 / transcript=MONOS_6056.1 / gene=MONOS_6056 / organism=Monocercomonoides_exilis_PA203 / gene_product=unspecified product / transcript_product=unspecified product / location=Mono_scaffold00185:98036-98580(-) / protein_length=77 / sequence_SO=supercontig / SO=protein_coding / is_pseudo=false
MTCQHNINPLFIFSHQYPTPIETTSSFRKKKDNASQVIAPDVEEDEEEEDTVELNVLEDNDLTVGAEEDEMSNLEN